MAFTDPTDTPVDYLASFSVGIPHTGPVISASLDGNHSTSITLQISGSVVVVSGAFVNLDFGVAIDYLNNDDQKNVASSFGALPPTYHAITKYAGPSVSTRVASLTVRYDAQSTGEGDAVTGIFDVTHTFTVTYNRNTANQQLKNYVAQGEF